jgi:Protein of unknown function (DUF3105)
VATKRSKASKQSKAQERQERLRELQKQQKRVERRRNLLIFGTTAVVAVAIIGGTAWAIMRQDDGGGGSVGRLEAASDDLGISGLRSAEVEADQHVEGEVDYPESPPVGGDHNPAWQSCGFYDEPVQDENGVHSLEHGAVWITYRDNLDDDQVQKLRDLTTPGNYVLVTPHDDIGAPVVASAWGYQLELDRADDPRLQQFLEKFVQGPQTRENATCDGGVGEPQFSE